MKAIHVYAGVIGVALSVSLPVSAAMPGQGWDVFRSGASESGVGEAVAIQEGGYQGTSLGTLPGQGWDVFRSGAIDSGVGQALPQTGAGYEGTSMESSPSRGYDLFRSGATDSL